MSKVSPLSGQRKPADLPPEPTSDNPLAQLDWLINRVADSYDNEASRQSYKALRGQLRAWLKVEGRDAQFFILTQHLTQTFLQDFARYQYDRVLNGEIGGRLVQMNIGFIRRLLTYANSKSLTAYPKGQPFFPITIPRPCKTGPGRGAYTKQEMEQVEEMLRPWRSMALSVKVDENGLITGPVALAPTTEMPRFAAYVRKGTGRSQEEDALTKWGYLREPGAIEKVGLREPDIGPASAFHTYWSYEAARDYVRQQGFCHIEELQAWCKTTLCPPGIPSNPYSVYKANGDWQGLEDFLGPTFINRQNMWRNWDDIVWYFENRMGCQTLPSQEVLEKHYTFWNGCQRYGGLRAVYEKLHEDATYNGGFPCILTVNLNLLAPLFCHLLFLTGMNVESALRLLRNCLRTKDPISGHPYLVYYKARGKKAHKKLYLSHLATDAKLAAEAGQDIGSMQLKEKRGKHIINLVNLILKLTEPCRTAASAADRDYLFLLNIGGTIRRMQYKDIHSWFQLNTDKFGFEIEVEDGGDAADEAAEGFRSHFEGVLKAAGGVTALARALKETEYAVRGWLVYGGLPKERADRLAERISALVPCAEKSKLMLRDARHRKDPTKRPIVLSRFRPTRVTEMIEDGASLLQVSAAMGHEWLSSTMGYIARHNIRIKWHKRAIDRSERIHAMSVHEEQNPKPYADKKIITLHVEGVKYPGAFSDCMNVFDGPNRQNPEYREGQPCTNWNACLLCKNVLILKKHLPLLASLELQLEYALSGKARGHPQEEMFELMLAIIDEYFAKVAKDDPEAAERARKNAKFGDVYVNAFLSGGGDPYEFE